MYTNLLTLQNDTLRKIEVSILQPTVQIDI